MDADNSGEVKRAWFVGYLPYVDGDFDYEDYRARCQTRRTRTPARLTRRRIR